MASPRHFFFVRKNGQWFWHLRATSAARIGTVFAVSGRRQFPFIIFVIGGRVMVQRMMTQVEIIEKTLVECQSAWSGCQWEMRFGDRTADLRGLHSRQAWLAAQATRGSESDYWREVYRYLEMVEKDARRASELASEAIMIWRRGNVAEALSTLDQAIELESHYRDPPAYSKLRVLIETAPVEISG